MQMTTSTEEASQPSKRSRWSNVFGTRVGNSPGIIFLACLIGLLAGYGATLFTILIHSFTEWTIGPFLGLSGDAEIWGWTLMLVPAGGLFIVAWFTRQFAPEAQGHGVPEVILAVARRDGIIRPRVSLVKILASGFCIGTGGSVGREGPIVQIGSALGSAAGQWFKLPAGHLKVLVACGAAAGISATFHAPLAGVIFAGEVILCNFAVRSLTPIVIASVLADVVQVHIGEHGIAPAFRQLNYVYYGNVQELSLYFILGLVCGVAAVGFTKALYAIEDIGNHWIPRWWHRALVAGLLVGVVGVLYPNSPPALSSAEQQESQQHHRKPMPAVFGVGYPVVDHTLHMENAEKPESVSKMADVNEPKKSIRLSREQLWAHLWWLLPLVFLKPLLTSITLAGGGSGGIFAPSLFLGATLGASFGLLANLLVPEFSGHPGIYAVVGMGAVVSGTTHGPLSAILIVYEMTGDYRIILPIMTAAGLSSIVAAWIDKDSIYHKKLTRRGESLTRGHDVASLENIMVRDMMLKHFPIVRPGHHVKEIIAMAKKHPHLERLPMLDDNEKFVGFIYPEELSRILEGDIFPELVCADDLAVHKSMSVKSYENLLEALSDFGSSDVELLPVEEGRGESRKLVGLLLRSHVMQRYRQELLSGGD